MKSLPEIESMYQSMMATVAPKPERYDPSKHGMTIAMLAKRWQCSLATAKKEADAQCEAGNWQCFRVIVENAKAKAYRAVSRRKEKR